jgi:phenylpropionate dioxygenase-like ring-hydroxylating dioxygenase large terminal subunit
MVSTTPISARKNNQQGEIEKSLFQWKKQWYPIAVKEYLDSQHPHQIELLGKKMVLWCDRQQQWHCFEDACPHRLVPLSEGRIEEDGTLLCSYHAWRFNGDGDCVSIPQSLNSEIEARNCNNSKACAIVYPVKEAQGLLWVWGDNGKEAQIESQQKQPAIIPELEEKDEKIVKLFWNIRDLPYGWDYFIENVTDPAHVPVSHHGIMGNRYSDAKYYDMGTVRKISTEEGFSFSITSNSPLIKSSITDFKPPSHVRIVTEFTDGGKLILALYAVPTRPGWCRHIGCQVLVKNDQGKTPPGLAFFTLPMPKWLGHILASLFLHQDMVFLHHQEQNINQRQDNWLNAVYTPNPQDKMVITFRQWLKYRAGNSIPWFGKPSLSDRLDSRQLFDVYHTHTKNCRYCQTALSRINKISVASYIGAGTFILIAFWLDIHHQSLFNLNSNWSSILLLSLGIISGVKGSLLKKLSRLFYIYKFSHSDNH